MRNYKLLPWLQQHRPCVGDILGERYCIHGVVEAAQVELYVGRALIGRALVMNHSGLLRGGPGVSRLRRIASKNYTLDNLYHEIKFRFSPLYQKKPLIIYQMGKVGSSTIERSLSAYGLERPVHRVHSLVKAHILRGLNESGLSPREYYQRSKHFVSSRYLIKEVSRGLRRGHWQVVTLVRDPIAQNISSFFQIVDMLISNFEQRALANELSTEELLDVFLEHYNPECIFNNWFDVEMKPVFDVDVFSSEFPKDQGYQIYRQQHVDLLLLRLEDVNRCAPLAFKEFIGLDDFRIVTRNEAKQKKYYKLYKNFCEKAVLPRAYIDQVYSSKYARHFYTQDEISDFRNKLNVGD